ncbi:hypothetical protein RRG08_066045 [Elysia crispata]|uniref:Zinc finger CW-type PWWP domain protein 1 n=1 Tax=Elysia crispata TaxID=231223 RepID=A0AAE1CRL7_9GAST|nr:hypothetical protein RRG08_066045 [Elysia crispata]
MEDTNSAKKPMKKSFLAPLKSKDGSKSEQNKPTLEHLFQKENLLAPKGNGNEQRSKKIQKSLKPDTNTGKKKVKDKDVEKGAKEWKPESDIRLSKEKNKQSEISNKAVKNCDDDLASIASDDVDAWTDSSPLNGAAEDNRGHQPAHKNKSVIQNKAERSGILKPKKLIFPEPEKKYDHDNEEAVVKKSKDKKCHDIVNQPKNRKFSTVDPSLSVKKKKREKKSSKGLPPDEKESNHQADEETGTWIQCSKIECGKWRYVAGIEDPILVPAKWECKMNPDKEHNTCDLPEVDYDESEHICTKFTIGSLVWAKMDGYPWWPGMIEADPDYDTYFELLTEKSMVPFQYHVTFFDDHVSRAWIKTNFISPYIKGQEPPNKLPKILKGRNSYQKEIQKAENNADKAVSLSLQERINTFGFLKRYNKKPGIKGNHSDKTNTKYCKKLKDEKKRSKDTLGSTKTHDMNEKDTDYSSSINNLSDDLEDSEYKPVKTKSRGFESIPANENIQILNVESIKSDCYLEGNKTKSSPDTCKERYGNQQSTETKFDPDIFTMENDSAPPFYQNDETTVKNQCKANSNVGKENFVVNEKGDEREENRCITDNICGEKIGQKDTNHSNSNKKEFGICSKVQQGKKTKTKTNLKYKKINTSYKEKHETHTLTENPVKMKEDNTCKINKSEDDKIPLVCEKKTLSKEQPLKTQKKLSEYDDDTTNASKKEDKKKKEKTKQVDLTFGFNSESAKDPKRGKKREGRNHNRTKPTSNQDLKTDKCEEVNDTIEGKCEKVNKKGALKNRSKISKKTKSESDSDKENLDPFEDAISERKKEIRKGLKRQANASINLKNANVKDSNTDAHKVKKLKISLTPDDYSNKETKTDKIKEEKSKPNKNDFKLSKKKVKSFAAPLKTCKSSDREVPQISLVCNKEDSKYSTYVNSNPTEGANNTDQHVVPDMSEETDRKALLDTDIEQLMFDETLKSNKNVFKPSQKKSKSKEDNMNNYESDDEALDLDMDLQKVGPTLPQNFLNDSDESDADDMECEPNSSKVVVEKVKEDMQVFGRFAGRCTDHGSDSDPMELIED